MRQTDDWRWGRLLGFDRPPVRLDEDRHAAIREGCIADLRRQLEHVDTDLSELTQQADDDYREQARRVDRAEQRAASIQAAVATLLVFTVSVGSVAIASGFAKVIVHRLAISVLTICLVSALVVAAAHVLAAQAVQHEWVRPNAAQYVTSRAGLGDQLHLETLGALIAAARHNAAIADWKHHHVLRGAKILGVALVLLALAPILVLVGTLIWPR